MPGTVESNELYRIVRMSGRPVLAIPAGPRRIRGVAARRFQGTTWKRTAFQYAIRCAVATGLDKWLWRKESSPLGPSELFPFRDWLADVRAALDVRSIYAAVVWPPQRDRGRVYVHVLSDAGVPIAFAKISLDDENDSFLSTECTMLEELQQLDLRHFSVPKLLHHGLCEGHRYLVMEPLPDNARPVANDWSSFPEEGLAELAGQPRRLSPDELNRLDWWKAVRGLDGLSDAFVQDLEASARDGLSVCRVHGDMGPGNLINNRGRLWLFDWEQSSHHGPVATDHVGFFLGLNQSMISNDPTAGLRNWASQYLSAGSPYHREDALAALAYLHLMKMPTATALIRHWGELVSA